MLEVGIKAYKFFVNGRYLCIPISVLVCFFYFFLCFCSCSCQSLTLSTGYWTLDTKHRNPTHTHPLGFVIPYQIYLL